MDFRIAIVKVGSTVVTTRCGDLDYSRLAILLDDVVHAEALGWRVVIITAGAIAAGRSRTIQLRGVTRPHRDQILASIGQPRLMGFLQSQLERHGRASGQVLLSRESFASRTQYFAIRDTLRGMLMNSVIPIVNDNDLLHAQVAEFSDNDQLAACLAGMLSAEMVVFLSNVSGVLVQSEGSDVFEGPITTNDEFSKLLSLLWKSHDGHGGMISKVRAAKLLFDLGIESVIGSGRSETPIQASLDCTMKGTRFQPNSDKRMKGVRKWLCAGAIPKGVIVVSDLGAEVIVSTTERGSLLAAGIVNVSGSFEKEDVVSVCTQDNRLLGYGISRFASDEIPAIVNQKGVVVIHADYFYGTQFGFAGNGHDSDG